MQPIVTALSAADVADGNQIGQALLSLNNANAVELSWLDPARLRSLVSAAFVAWRVGEADALLLAFDQCAEYDSPNFLWFRAHLKRFVYVDRVVVAPSCRGHGYARLLYHHLFQQAAQASHDRIVCEVNQHPPNPSSDTFHTGLGFREIGSARPAGGSKRVRYLSCPIERQQ